MIFIRYDTRTGFLLVKKPNRKPVRAVNRVPMHKSLGLCIVSMIQYDMYRRYIDAIHDTYRDTYRIIYILLNTNIVETVIKLKSHMSHANNRGWH